MDCYTHDELVATEHILVQAHRRLTTSVLGWGKGSWGGGSGSWSPDWVCTLGAVNLVGTGQMRCTEFPLFAPAVAYLHAAVWGSLRGSPNQRIEQARRNEYQVAITNWNDEFATYEEVLAVFKRAIALVHADAVACAPAPSLPASEADLAVAGD